MKFYISKSYIGIDIGVTKFSLIELTIQNHNYHGSKYGFDFRICDYRPRCSGDWRTLFAIYWQHDYGNNKCFNIWLWKRIYHWRKRG